MQGMAVLRKDRDTQPGGGCALYYNDAFAVEEVNDPTLLNLPDSLFCYVRPNQSQRILLGVMYRPPSTNAERNTQFLSCLEQCTRLKHDGLLITGDFNLPHANFQVLLPEDSDTQTSNFSRLVQSLQLTQHVNQPTRFDSNGCSILDLIFTDEPFSIPEVRHCPPLGSSDHAVLHFELIYHTATPIRTGVPRLNFRKADYDAINRELASTVSPPWSTFRDTNDHWSWLRSQIARLTDMYVPLCAPRHDRAKDSILRKATKRMISKNFTYGHSSVHLRHHEHMKYTASHGTYARR